MATTYLPAANSLMMTGPNENKLAIHGDKKLGVFPDWWFETKSISGQYDGMWGGYTASGSSTKSVSWRVPFDSEPEVAMDTTRWMTECMLPDVYVIQKTDYENEEAFMAKVALCETIYGIEFMVTGIKDAAIAERRLKDGEEWPCKLVIPGCYTVLYVLNEEKNSVALEKLREKHGRGSYAIGIALKMKDEERFFRNDADTVIYDRLLYWTGFGYQDSDNVKYAGYAIYKMYGDKVEGPIRLNLNGSLGVRLHCTYHVIVNMPTYATTVQQFADKSLYNYDDAYKNHGWATPLGVFDGVSGTPTVKSTVQ